MKRIAALLVMLSLSACVNNVDKFYKADGMNPHPSRVIATTGPAEIIYSSPDNIAEKMYDVMEDGYVYIGGSSFVGELADEKHIQAVASKVGASRVLFMHQFNRTDDQSFVMQMPSTQTTYHSGTVGYLNTQSGNYNSANMYGTSTTYGTTPMYFPNKVDFHDQQAAFFVKRKPGGFGVFVNDLTPEERKATNSNFGATIKVVIKGSSAFNANLMRDDIIISMNGTDIKDANHFIQIAQANQGKDNVPMTIYRDGNVYSLNVNIDPL